MEPLQELLMTFQSKKRASKRQLESLIGELNWACQVIQGGRNFLRRVINAKNTLRRQSDKFFWIVFLRVWSGGQLFYLYSLEQCVF